VLGSNNLRLVLPFTTGTFNPKEKVTVNGQKITLAQCASGMNEVVEACGFQCEVERAWCSEESDCAKDL